MDAIHDVAGLTPAALRNKFKEEPLLLNQEFQQYVDVQHNRNFANCLASQLSARRAKLKAPLLESLAKKSLPKKSSDEEMEDEAVGTTIKAPEEDKQEELPEGEEEDPILSSLKRPFGQRSPTDPKGSLRDKDLFATDYC